MSRHALERHQVWVYLIAIALGLVVGSARPALGALLEVMLWPALALLMFVTFVQVPLLQVHHALRDRRFAFAVLAGNFVLLPLLAWSLVGVFDLSPVMRLGVLLVLLVPCTDWFISFSQLGRGDVPHAIAITPLNLLLQLALLPLFLWVLADVDTLTVWEWSALAPALLVVLVPLAAALLAERWTQSHSRSERVRAALAWWPVPLLALVVFLIAAEQVGTVRSAGPELWTVVPLFVMFLLGAALLASMLSRVLRLPTEQGRTLAFSMGTRNSFVVLPLALSLPAGWEVAAVVVVMQSLVELFGMVLYVWWVPKHLFR